MIAFVLSVALLGLEAPAERTCEPGDNACKAELYLQRARTAPTAEQRAKYLHAAHRSYLFLYDQTGKAGHLCAARRAYEQGMAVQGEVSAATRGDFTVARGALESRERTAGEPCGRSAKRPKKDPPAVAAKLLPIDPPPPMAASPNDGATVGSPPLAPPTPTPQPDPPTSTVPLQVTRHDSPTDALLPVPRHSSGRVPRATARPGQRMVIAGGASLAAGLALTGVAGYLGGRLLDTTREGRALEQIDGFASENEIARDAELKQEYRRLGPPTLALALAGGSTIVVSAVLLGIGGRRMARASRTALMPFPGGLLIRARF